MTLFSDESEDEELKKQERKQERGEARRASVCDDEGTQDTLPSASASASNNHWIHENELIFSSLEIHFYPSVFLEQLLFHIFFPFSVPFAMLKYGIKHSYLQGYHYSMIVFGHVSSYLPFVCMVAALYCISMDRDSLDYSQLVLPFGVTILQRVMIAVKYATLSPEEYRSFLDIGNSLTLSPEDIKKVTDLAGSIQLLRSWVIIPESLIRHELLSAALRQGIDLENLIFYIPVDESSPSRDRNPKKLFSDWMRLQNDIAADDENKKTSKVNPSEANGIWEFTRNKKFLKARCQDVLEHMYKVLNQNVKQYMVHMAVLVYALDAIVVYNYCKKYSRMPKDSIYIKIYFASTMYLLAFFFPILIGFCCATMVDVYRRYRVSRMLRELISPCDVQVVDTAEYFRFNSKKIRHKSIVLNSPVNKFERKTFKSFSKNVLPRIDMSVPTNYVSWCLCRLTLFQFGKRFQFRTDLYMAVLAILAIILLINTLYDMFFSSLSTAEVCESYILSQTVTTLCAVVTIICTLMVGIYATNRDMQRHCIPLSIHLQQANRSLHTLHHYDLFGECGETQKQEATGQHLHRRRKSDVNTILNDAVFEDREKSLQLLQDCIESANSAIQTVVETDAVEPLRIMNVQVEKEYIISIASSAILYGIVLFNFCDAGN